VKVSEILTSPLQRAVQTAEIIGSRYGIHVARDPRLTDFDVGEWSGKNFDEVLRSEGYRAFVANPGASRIPGGESLDDVRRRAVAAIGQALEDNPPGDSVAMVSHAGVIRVLLAHYLGSPVANYHRLRVSAGSISVLAFADDRELPRVLAVNHVGSIVTAIGPSSVPDWSPAARVG
jgi:broad specificity phosphatase PhoE